MTGVQTCALPFFLYNQKAAYDEVLDRSAAEADLGLRKEQLESAERVMLADVPVLPLYFYIDKHLVSPRVLGWYDNVMNVVYSRDLALRE